MSLTHFKSWLVTKGYSSKTIKSYKRILIQFLNWLEKEEIKDLEVRHQDILAYMQNLKIKNLSQKSINHYLGVIKLYYQHLNKEENPTTGIVIQGIKRKILYDLLETKELDYLYNHYPNKSLQDKRNKVILGLILYQAIKAEELAKLQLKHIQIKEGKILVPSGKKSNPRTLNLQSQQIIQLHEYIHTTRIRLMEYKPKRKSQTRKVTNLLFIAEGGNLHSMSNLITQIMIKARKINPKVINAKHLRASTITQWIKSHNLREVQYMAGHRYISSTEAYQINNLDSLIEEIEKYHPLG